MRRGIRALVFLAASGGLRAGATPPPISEAEEVSEENGFEVDDVLDRCGKAATRDRVYGVVEISFVNGHGRPAVSLGRTRFLRPADVACVRRALRRAKLTPFDGPGFRFRKWLPLGEVRPLFSRAFLPAWKAAVAGSGGRLASLLPAEVRISSPGCLRFRGPEPLEPALDAWLEKTGRAPASGNVTPSYALPDGWWIWVDEHWRMTDELAGMVDEEICLDRVDAAVSALRRDRVDKGWVEGADVAYDAEWVVDGAGRLVGEIGFCVAPPRLGPGHIPATPAEVEALPARLAARFRALDFGRRRGYERVVLHYGPDEKMRAEGRTATAPLAPGESSVEASCRRRAALQCARESASYSPIEIDRPALARCAAAWSKGADDLAVAFDLGPEGRVDKSRIFSTSLKRPRGPHDKWPAVPASLSSCMQKVFRRMRFPEAPGGPCPYSTRLAAFL
jgi:hypothetical protein